MGLPASLTHALSRALELAGFSWVGMWDNIGSLLQGDPFMTSGIAEAMNNILTRIT